jgi:hypothetical protein
MPADSKRGQSGFLYGTHLVDQLHVVAMQSENLEGDLAAIQKPFENIREMRTTLHRVRRDDCLREYARRRYEASLSANAAQSLHPTGIVRVGGVRLGEQL